MSFSESVRLKALISCRRICPLCRKFCGTHMELHHIRQRANGGPNTFENCIPLCLDCHANVRTYNTGHPKGLRYTEQELIKLRDILYNEIEQGKIKTMPPIAAEKFDLTISILRKLFSEQKDAIGTVVGYARSLYSYADLRESFKDATPETIDKLTRFLAEHNYVETKITRDPHGNVGGCIRITGDGLAFFYENQ